MVPEQIATPSSPWVCLCLLIQSLPHLASKVGRGSSGTLVLVDLPSIVFLSYGKALFPFLLGRVWIFARFVH